MKRSTLIRGVVILWTLLVTAIATWCYGAIVAGGAGLNWIEVASIAFFAVLFGWITFSFGLAFVGWVVLDARPSRRCDVGGV